MRIPTRSFTVAMAALFAAAAIAQKTHTLQLSGNVMSGSIGDSVHVHVGQGEVYPAIDIDLPLDSNGYYIGFTHIESMQIDVTTWTSCGSKPSLPGYSMLFDETDDTLSDLFETLYCESYIDCRGIPKGPSLVGTPCKPTKGTKSVWTVNCECNEGPLRYPGHQFGKKD